MSEPVQPPAAPGGPSGWTPPHPQPAPPAAAAYPPATYAYPPPGYVPYGPAPAAPIAARTNGLAIASLVLGLLWLYGVGSILAMIFGHVAMSQIDGSRGGQTGRGMALAGAILGYIGTAVLVLVILVAASA